MKNILLFFLIYPLFSYSQTKSFATVFSNYVVEDGAVMYIKTFEMPGLSKHEIREQLISHLSSKAVIRIDQPPISDDQLQGTIKQSKINYLKYGGKRNASAWGSLPFNGVFAIQIKDGKYKIITKTIEFESYSKGILSLNKDYVSKHDKLLHMNLSKYRIGYYYLGKTIEGFFDLKEIPTSNW